MSNVSSSFFLFLHVLSWQSKQWLNYIIFLIIFKRPYIDILIIVSFFPLKLLNSFFLSVKKSHFQAVYLVNKFLNLNYVFNDSFNSNNMSTYYHTVTTVMRF
jgi:hypothetical protein